MDEEAGSSDVTGTAPQSSEQRPMPGRHSEAGRTARSVVERSKHAFQSRR